MFSRLPTFSERLVRTLQREPEGPVDPLVAGSGFLLSISIGASLLLYSINPTLSNLDRRMARSNCSINPDSSYCTKLTEELSFNTNIYIGTSIILGVCVPLLGELIKRCYNKFKNDTINPHHKLAYTFYSQHMEYPADKIGEEIYCPILNDITNQPIFVEITYKDGKQAVQVYDYDSLKAWLLENTTDPATNINLLDLDQVKTIKFSFDNPLPEYKSENALQP